VGFSVSHLLIAEKYQKMVKKVELIFKNQPISPPTKQEQSIWKVLFAANISLPIVSCAFAFLTACIFFPNWPTTPWIVASDILETLLLLLPCVTGVSLVVSVARIARFFRDRNDDRFVNTAMMQRHAAAFILFLLASVGLLTTTLILSLNMSRFYYLVAWDDIAADFFIFTEFISESLLVPILWELGTEMADENEPIKESYEPVITTVWDEDAEIQAHIWSIFTRCVPGEDDGGYKLSSAAFKSARND
jgi:hypothetical protein